MNHIACRLWIAFTVQQPSPQDIEVRSREGGSGCRVCW